MTPKKPGVVRAWAVYAKEGNRGWTPQYEAHFLKSIAKNKLSDFKASNAYRKNVKFKIVEGIFRPLPIRRKRKP